MDEHLLEAYLINTARHTEETPVAEWVSLPTDAETMKAVFERLGVDGSDTEQYQVSAFHSSLDGWSEALKPGESLDDLNYLAALLTQRSNRGTRQVCRCRAVRRPCGKRGGLNQPDAQSGLLLALSHRTQFRRLRALPH